MTPSSQTLSHLMKAARAALLFGCLCFLVFQQLGYGARLLVDTLCLTQLAAQSQTLSSDAGTGTHESFSTDRLAPANEAVLTEKRERLPSADAPRSRHPLLPISTFHNNCRPILLRTRAIYCDFSLLRCILHPHFRFLENTATVLC